MSQTDASTKTSTNLKQIGPKITSTTKRTTEYEIHCHIEFIPFLFLLYIPFDCMYVNGSVLFVLFCAIYDTDEMQLNKMQYKQGEGNAFN